MVPPEVKAAVLRRLADSGIAFDTVADLCELSARQDPSLQRLAAGGGLKSPLVFPRAVKWLFHAAQADLPLDTAEVLNMRVQTADEVAAALLAAEVHPNLPRGKVTAADAPTPSAPTTSRPQPHSVPFRMSLTAQSTLRIVLHEGDAAQPLAGAERFAALTALLEKGFAVARTVSGSWETTADRQAALVLGRFTVPAIPPLGEGGPGVHQPRIQVADITGLDAAGIVEFGGARAGRRQRRAAGRVEALVPGH